MKSLLIYLIQLIASSGILYGYYHFFLRNRRFHQYNRFYLLAIPLISLVIPFLTIEIYFNSQQDIPVVYQLLSEVRIGNKQRSGAVSPFLRSEMVYGLLYGLVGIFFFMRFSAALLKIRRLLKIYRSETLNDISFINTDEEDAPYSFFRWLFWNKKISLDSPNGRQIFRHELFHIRQKHSVDLIYAEMLTIIFWINPFFHLVKKEIKAIHEFLSDQFAAQNSSRWDYVELLLMQALQTKQSLVNPFFHNQIKRRIAMITNPSKTSYQYLRKVMVLPVVAILVALTAFNCTTKDEINKPDSAATTTLEKTTETLASNKIFEKVEIEPAFPGGATEWRKYLEKNLNPSIPVDNGAPEGTYTVMAQFIVHTDGFISDLKTLTKHGYGMEDEVVRVLSKGPRWEPAIQNGKKINAYRKQPVTFQIQAE